MTLHPCPNLHRHAPYQPTGDERRWRRCRFVSLSALGSALAANFIVLAIIFGAYGLQPALLVLLVHISGTLAALRFTLHALPHGAPLAWAVDEGFWALDAMVGSLLLGLASLLCVGNLVARLQAVLLFSTKFARWARNVQSEQIGCLM